jgi:signal transduction histidine kinase
MTQLDQYQAIIDEKLYLNDLREISIRSLPAVYFQVIGFLLTIFLSPLRESDPLLSYGLFSIILIAGLWRMLLCRQQIKQPNKSEQWFFKFSILSGILFFTWAIWLSLHYYFHNSESISYVISIILSTICSSAVIAFAPSLKLSKLMILSCLLLPMIVLLMVGGRESYVLSFLLLMFISYQLIISKKVNTEYRNSFLNAENSIQSKKITEEVLNSIPGLVSCVDYELKYIWVNQELVQKFGIELKNGKHFLGSLNYNPELPSRVQQFIQSEKNVDQFEYNLYFPEGPRWVMMFLRRYEEFGKGRVLIVSYDIQANKEAEAELEFQRSKATESAKLATLGEMSAGIAHEINNPLAVLKGKAELMIRDLKKGNVVVEALIANLEKVVHSSDRIAKIIKGLKSFSRNGENDDFELISVESIINDVLDFSRERFKMHGIELQMNVDPSLKVKCRSTQIGQVVLNLLNNSFDAIVESKNSWVKVEAKADSLSKNVVISITDSGGGIHPDVVAKLMQPFFTTKEVGKGTGLGLSISLGIIKSHEGDFYYDSNSSNTKFVIQLPLH